MNFIKNHGLKLLFIAIPIVCAAIFWNDVPDRLPVHWDIHGEPNRYGSKAEAFLIIPVIIALVYGIFALVPIIDPKKNVDHFISTLEKFGHIIAVFCLFMFGVILSNYLGYEPNIGKWVMLGLTFLFFLLGNFFGKLRPNYFVGIRTPWTLENDENWNRTHRFAGALWVGVSAVMAMIVFFSNTGNMIFISFGAYLILIMGLPLWYSYDLYRESQK